MSPVLVNISLACLLIRSLVRARRCHSTDSAYYNSTCFTTHTYLRNGMSSRSESYQKRGSLSRVSGGSDVLKCKPSQMNGGQGRLGTPAYKYYVVFVTERGNLIFDPWRTPEGLTQICSRRYPNARERKMSTLTAAINVDLETLQVVVPILKTNTHY